MSDSKVVCRIIFQFVSSNGWDRAEHSILLESSTNRLLVEKPSQCNLHLQQHDRRIAVKTAAEAKNEHNQCEHFK